MIWFDMQKMEFSFVDNEGRWSDLDRLLKLSQGKMLNLKSDLKRLLKACFVNNAEVEETDKTILKNIYAQIFQTEGSNSELESDHDEILNEFKYHFPFFGLSTAFKKFQTKCNHCFC